MDKNNTRTKIEIANEVICIIGGNIWLALGLTKPKNEWETLE